MAVLAMAVLVLPGGYLLAHGYMRDRYDDYGAIPNLAAWARDTKDAEIAFVGLFIQYPLYGSDLSNRVDYLARHGPHGAFTTIHTCGEWRRALNAGRYDYVVTAPFNYPGSLRIDQPPEAEWTGSDPAARRILSDAGVVSLYKLDGRLNPTCDLPG